MLYRLGLLFRLSVQVHCSGPINCCMFLISAHLKKTQLGQNVAEMNFECRSKNRFSKLEYQGWE